MANDVSALRALVTGLLLAACTAALASGASDPTAPRVTIEGGLVQGVSEGAIELFKGIPFAAPPVGPLRWAPPEAAAHWTGVREAAEFGPDCMQQTLPMGIMGFKKAPGEDCLYVNVWRPKGTRNAPVMVWIYGGGFVMGGSSTPSNDGSQFARDGVVFVSFNYRVGRLGFFGFPALTAANPGGPLANYGYMDQIAALRWVKANIGAFGGNPHNVTIFGESSGGGSVNMLLTSPMGSGLFSKAIVESGGGRSYANGYRLVSKDLPDGPSADTIGVNFAKSQGIEGSGPEALKALRALPAEKVLIDLATLAPGRVNLGPPTYSGPVTDGKVVAMSPEEAYQANRFAHVPLIIGATSADYGAGTAKTVEEALAPFGADKQKLLDVYDPDHTGDLGMMNAKMGSDKTNVEPSRFVAQQFAARGVPAYEFRFSFVSSAAGGSMALMLLGAKPSETLRDYIAKGAGHGSEIPYVFDLVAKTRGEKTTDQERAMAKSVHTYWVNFAKSGNPNRPAAGNPEWPVYKSGSDMLLNFAQDGPKAMPDPWKVRLDLTAARKD